MVVPDGVVTSDAMLDWLEAQVTGGSDVSFSSVDDGRLCLEITERTESQDRDVATRTTYRAMTLSGLILRAMKEETHG